VVAFSVGLLGATLFSTFSAFPPSVISCFTLSPSVETGAAALAVLFFFFFGLFSTGLKH